MGPGFCWEIDQLTPEQQDSVRTRTEQRLSSLAVDAAESNAIHVVAGKPR